MYLIGYIAYGLHLLYKHIFVKEICRKPIPLHPGLGSSLYYGMQSNLGNSLVYIALSVVQPSSSPLMLCSRSGYFCSRRRRNAALLLGTYL